MAAVLSCGPGAAISHETAAALWGIRAGTSLIEVSVDLRSLRRAPGILIHRRSGLTAADLRRKDSVPVTEPVLTLVDIAMRLPSTQLEAAVNEADKLNLVDPESLRAALDRMGPRPGVGVLRKTLDRRTFTLTDSALERMFLPLARRAGLPSPQTQRWVNGFRVDFLWPELRLIVETDGLRYHRTAAEQARDRLRDQVHAAAGFTALRFTHAQVKYEPGHVVATLAAVAVARRAQGRGRLNA